MRIIGALMNSDHLPKVRPDARVTAGLRRDRNSGRVRVARGKPGFAELLLREREQVRRGVGFARPGTPFESLQELQHALTTSFPAEEGCGAGLLG
jgi:hypothetical protein